MSYRVSHNIVYTSVLLVSWPPKHVEVPSWTFFNSPFRVDFKTIKFFIIWWNFDRDIAKILKGSHFKNQHLLFINESKSWTLPITQEYSGALMSPYKHFLASLSIDDYGCKVLWVLKDPWHHNHECLLALMSAVCAMTPGSWMLMVAYNAHECSRVAVGPH